jgi:glycogen synthase
MRRRAMAQDFSWSRAIDDYERHFDWTMAVSWRRCGRAVTS